jgi:HK97 family phage portal protein
VNIFGLEIRRAGAAPVSDTRGGWWPLVREPFTGAWQRNQEWTVDTVLAHHAVYTCITLIAQDVGKLRPRLVERDEDGIWSEVESPAFSPVLRKPNRFQNRIQFFEWWITSKLIRGNAYVLLRRDNRGVVIGMYLLDPNRVRPMVAPDGEVFYELQGDNLIGEEEAISVPASEIIHDRMNCLFHPLVGTSPIFACGMAAHIGLTVQRNSADFFGQGSNPSGVLTAPGTIPQETAVRLKEHWERNYSGANSGRVAVLGDGLKFEPMRMTAVDSQLIEHLKWSAETVAATFHVPAFKIGVGQMPTYSNGELLDQRYYSDCLQSHLESLELCLDEGLGLGGPVGGRMLGVEMDLDGLLRMDSSTQVKTLSEAVSGAILTPNEARRKLDARPLTGGDTVYMQQQNYSLAALDARDRTDPLVPQSVPAALPPGDEGRSAAREALALEILTATIGVAA